jgi:exoribonuclease II
MEYDSTFVTAHRSQLKCRLTPTTISLIKRFSEFYAVEPDQLIETAIGRFIAQDREFLNYLEDNSSNRG